MKNFLVLGLFAASLAMFFSCSNDGLDIKDLSPAKSSFVSCSMQDDVVSVSADVCAEIGGEIVLPPSSSSPDPLLSSSDWVSSSDGIEVSSSDGIADLSSSSSDGIVDISSSDAGEVSSSDGIVDLSSSDNGGVSSDDGGELSSSSDIASSSSGAPDPIPDGKFEFRSFDYSSSGSKIYFFASSNSSNMRESKSDPPQYGQSGQLQSGRLLNTLVGVSNPEANCVGEITVRSTLGGTPYEIPKSGNAGTGAAINIAGKLISKAYMMCDGIEKEIASTEAEVAANPTWDENCALPSTYVYGSEPVQNVAKLNNNYGRCNITYSPATYPATASNSPAPFSTTATCSGYGTKTCNSLPLSVIAAHYLNATTATDGQKFSDYAKTGKIVVQLPANTRIIRIGCDGSDSFAFAINGTISNHSYWGYYIFSPSIYENNGNRILFETTLGTVRECFLSINP